MNLTTHQMSLLTDVLTHCFDEKNGNSALIESFGFGTDDIDELWGIRSELLDYSEMGEDVEDIDTTPYEISPDTTDDGRFFDPDHIQRDDEDQWYDVEDRYDG